MNQITLCPSCNCMTKTVDDKCGKCGENKPMKQQWEEQTYKEFTDLVDEAKTERIVCGEWVTTYDWGKIFDWFLSKPSQAKAERTEEILDLIDCEIDCEATAGYQTVWGYNLKKRISSLHLKESEK